MKISAKDFESKTWCRSSDVQAAIATRPPLPEDVAQIVWALKEHGETPEERIAAEMLEALALDAARRNQALEQMAYALEISLDFINPLEFPKEENIVAYAIGAYKEISND